MKYPLVYNDKCFLNSRDVIDYVSDKIDRDFASIIDLIIYDEIADEVSKKEQLLEGEYGTEITVIRNRLYDYETRICQLLDICQTLVNYAKCEECLNIKAIQDLNDGYEDNKEYFIKEGVY